MLLFGWYFALLDLILAALLTPHVDIMHSTRASACPSETSFLIFGV
jgi:hypothetical protein